MVRLKRILNLLFQDRELSESERRKVVNEIDIMQIDIMKKAIPKE